MTAAVKTQSKSSKSATKGKKVKESKTPKASAPAPVPTPVVSEPVENVEVVEVSTIETSMTELLKSFSESIQTLTSSLNKLKSDYKFVEKQLLKEARSMDKVNAKRNKNKGTRAPSGFVKPAGISKQLAKFLGVSEDTKIARTDVTKEVNKYIKEHNLQNPANKKEIKADSTLTKLLNLKKGDDLNYFSLQKFLKDHFPKEDTSVSA